MFCEQCGRQLPDGSKFCKYCGASQAEQPEEPPQAPPAAQPVPEPKPRKKPSKKAAIILGSILGFLVLATAALVVFLSLPKTIQLNPVISIEISGYNGTGEALWRLDALTLHQEIQEKCSFPLRQALKKAGSQQEQDQAKALEAAAKLEACLRSVHVEFQTPSTRLSNGDVVTARILFDEALAKDVGLRFSAEPVTVTVEGLEDLRIVDPFEDLQVSFVGVAPYGSASVLYTGDTSYLGDYAFVYDDSKGLSNGDSLTIQLQYDKEAAAQNGVAVEITTRYYSVTGLPTYHLPQSFLDGSGLEPLLELAHKESDSMLRDACSYYIGWEDLQYEGYIFQVSDGNSPSSAHNRLFLIYRTVLHEDGFVPQTLYIPALFTNVLLGPENGIQEGTFAGFTDVTEFAGYTISGYRNPMELLAAKTVFAEAPYQTVCGGGFEAYLDYPPAQSLEQFSSGFLAALEEDALAQVTAYMAEAYPPMDVEFENIRVAFHILHAAKDFPTEDLSSATALYVVVAADISHYGDAFKEPTIYIPVLYRGAYTFPDGAGMFYESSGLVGTTCLFSGRPQIITPGYADLALLEEELIHAFEIYHHVFVDETFPNP